MLIFQVNNLILEVFFLKRILLVFCLLFSFSLFKTGEVQASSADDAVYYDLEKGGTQEFITSDSSGTTIHIVVEELSGISLFSMNNGSYKISGRKAGFWEASYYVSVLNENITRAYSPSATAITGSFSSTRLTLDSNKQATFYLAWKSGFLNNNIYLRSTISNGSLLITY